MAQSWDLRMLLGLTSLPPLGPSIARQAIIRWRDSIYAQLSREPLRFRDELRSCAGIICGSAIIRALEASPDDPKPWKPHEYDIFVPRATFKAFCAFVQRECEGNITDRAHFAQTSNPHIGERRIIRTPVAVLCVYATRDPCPLVAIAASPLNIQLSFLSADTLCVAYPWAVYYKHATSRPGPTTDDTPETRETALHQTYARRGYNFRALQKRASGNCLQHGMCPKQTRHFGDDSCMTIVFHDASEPRPNVRPSKDNLHMTASWVFGGQACGNATCAYGIQSSVHSAMVCSDHPLF